jgi:hypothetical protein
MVNSHSKSFFGQNTGIILTSWSKYDPYVFLNFIKMKSNGIWEKLSDNEGRTIKITLEEIISILKVLNHQKLSWQNSHTYKEMITSFSFSWQDETSENLWINIDNYSKMLTPAQIEIFRLLLTHLLHEKIIYSTALDLEHQRNKHSNHSDEKEYDIITNNEEFTENISEINEEILNMNSNEYTQMNDVTNIQCIIIGETEKALMLRIGENDVWIPKSTIHNHYDPIKGKVQNFLISSWILKKNKIDS